MTSGLLRVMGLEFANRVGVAAGYDRDGSRLAELSAAGFAFIEVGTINVTADTGVRTALQAVVVNLTCYRLRSAPWSGVRGALIGVSIGTLREAFDAVAAAEIAAGAHALAPLADYLVVNLSRPGSACRDGAVGTQTLRSLLERVRAQVDAAGRAQWRRIPLLVKVAARPGDEDIVPEGARLAAALGYDGMVIAFERWPAIDAVCDRIAAMRARLGRTSLIAVGGVRNADIANRYLRAGADLVQVYSAVAESGPAIAAALIDGYRNVAASRPWSMT